MNADEQRSRADALRLPSRAKRSGASGRTMQALDALKFALAMTL